MFHAEALWGRFADSIEPRDLLQHGPSQHDGRSARSQVQGTRIEKTCFRTMVFLCIWWKKRNHKQTSNRSLQQGTMGTTLHGFDPLKTQRTAVRTTRRSPICSSSLKTLRAPMAVIENSLQPGKWGVSWKRWLWHAVTQIFMVLWQVWVSLSISWCFVLCFYVWTMTLVILVLGRWRNFWTKMNFSVKKMMRKLLWKKQRRIGFVIWDCGGTEQANRLFDDLIVEECHFLLSILSFHVSPSVPDMKLEINFKCLKDGEVWYFKMLWFATFLTEPQQKKLDAAVLSKMPYVNPNAQNMVRHSCGTLFVWHSSYDAVCMTLFVWRCLYDALVP